MVNESISSVKILNWNINEILTQEFWENFNEFIYQVEYEKEVDFGNPINHKQLKKFHTQITLFLWNLAENKIKYFFEFEFDYFYLWINSLTDKEYQFFKILIHSFRTEDFIQNLFINKNFNEMILGIYEEKSDN